jgi:hypothetical protein
MTIRPLVVSMTMTLAGSTPAGTSFDDAAIGGGAIAASLVFSSILTRASPAKWHF